MHMSGEGAGTRNIHLREEKNHAEATLSILEYSVCLIFVVLSPRVPIRTGRLLAIHRAHTYMHT